MLKSRLCLTNNIRNRHHSPIGLTVIWDSKYLGLIYHLRSGHVVLRMRNTISIIYLAFNKSIEAWNVVGIGHGKRFLQIWTKWIKKWVRSRSHDLLFKIREPPDVSETGESGHFKFDTGLHLNYRLLTKNNWQDRKKREIAIIENNKIQQILL